ncbi:neuronal acetylcholine receptor subunit alpha-6-like [Ptychodera flava]|uniref:neuronal acetylcholine receptor subunit alpha-6-like n=1 Tax=Ptychodera flava TaxID=63121 RepID=UPI00396A98B3
MVLSIHTIAFIEICFLLAFTCNIQVYVNASDTEERLRDDLFSNYNAKVRPAEHPGDAVTIDIVLAITQILDVDEKSQVMKASLWIYQIWNDYRLQWNPANYSGIFNIPVIAKEIWFPDTALYQSANEEHPNFPQVIAITTTGIVHSDGTVTMCTAHIYEIPCVMAIADFPFDVQSCPIYFGTWVHHKEDLDFGSSFDGIKKEGYIANTEWDIISSSYQRLEGDFLTFTGRYAYLEFTLTIERKPLYYIMNLNLPCALFSVLTVLVFYLPPDSADKLPLAVSILLTLFVFNLLVADIMPETSDAMPVLSVYLMVNMASVVLAVIFAAMVMKTYNQTGEVHGWMRTVFIEFLPKYLFFNSNDKSSTKGMNSKAKADSYNFNNFRGLTPSPLPRLRHIHHRGQGQEFKECEIPMVSFETDNVYSSRSGAENNQEDFMPSQILKRLDIIIEELRHRTEKSSTEQDEDWKIVGSVLNRLLLIVFFVLFLSWTIWLFIN